MRRGIWILVVGTVLFGCKKDDATPPASAANMQGVWSGQVAASGSTGSSVPVTLTLAQSGSAVSGTFASATLSGDVSGTVNGQAVSLVLVPGVSSPCASSLNASGTVNGDQLQLALQAQPGVVAKTIVVSTPVACPASTLTGQAGFTRMTTSVSLPSHV